MKALIRKVKERSKEMGLNMKLNMKKAKVMTIGKTTNRTPDEKDVEMVDSFCLLGSIINNKGSSSQEIRHRLALSRPRIKGLGKIFSYNGVSLQTKIRTVQAVVFSVVLYGCESWA